MKRNVFSITAVFLVAFFAMADTPPNQPRKKIFLPKNPRAAAYILRLKKNDDLVQLQRSAPVYVAILERAGIARHYRKEALAGLAKLHESDEWTELLEGIERVADPGNKNAEDVLRDLAAILLEAPAAELLSQSGALAHLTSFQDAALVRQIGYAALTKAHEGIDELVQSTPDDARADLLRAIPLLDDADLRNRFFPIVRQSWDDENPDTRRAAIDVGSYLTGHESEVLLQLASFVNRDLETLVAVRALKRIPQERWPAEAAFSVAESLVALVQRTAAAERTVSPAQDALVLVQTIASRLPADQARSIQARIDNLTVQQFTIRTPLEQMAYDPNVIVVKAGKPIEIVLVNDDEMPHNLLVAEPGSYEQVGLAAQALATNPDAPAKHYVPDLDSVLHATEMVWPRQQQRLSFTAPDKPGVYPFICTFPGHWLKMYGAMVVVEDVDAYLAAKKILPTADALLGRIPVREWKFDDLREEAASLDTRPRSFDAGKRYFAAASCVSCHRMRGEGVGNIGPELTEIAEKYKQPQDVLREMLEPSRNIEEKFASVVLYANGRALRGVVTKRTESQIYLKENPLIDCEPTIVNVDDLDEDGEHKSTVSPMPVGLLNLLHQDQIMDLLAYVFSGGNPNHEVFQGGN